MLTIFSHNHFFKKAMRLKINDIKAVRKANLVLNQILIQQPCAVSFFDKQL